MLKVLYEDNHLIAVFKPAGVLVQGDSTGDPTLMDEVKYYLKTKYHKLGKVWLGLLHRLDRPVSGVILFAKTSKGASRLSEQFRKHEVEKIYHAFVIGKVKKEKDTLIHHLKKDEKINRSSVVSENGGGQRAELSYEVVETHRMRLKSPTTKDAFDASLLRIHLGTGRPHQIRAQLSAIGHPIVGDVKYGAPEPLPDKCLALAATSLTFNIATGEQAVTASIPVPNFGQK